MIDGGAHGTTVGQSVRAYIRRNPEASVAQVLGRFVLDPGEYASAVAELLDRTSASTTDGQGGVEA